MYYAIAGIVITLIAAVLSIYLAKRYAGQSEKAVKVIFFGLYFWGLVFFQLVIVALVYDLIRVR
jgi:hypothetical protein